MATRGEDSLQVVGSREHSNCLEVLSIVRSFFDENVFEDRLEYDPEEFERMYGVTRQQAQVMYEITQELAKI